MEQIANFLANDPRFVGKSLEQILGENPDLVSVDDDSELEALQQAFLLAQGGQ